MGARVGSLAWCLSVWCRQQRKHASAAASLVVLLCTVSPFQPLPFPADVLQMGHKEREAEFWRIVEDGEDVVEVNSKMLTTFFGALMALDRSRQAVAS